MSTDMRFDPFRFEYRPVNLTGETRLVEYHTAFKRVGFFLKETPQRLQTQRISIVCGGDDLAEVGRTVEPPVDNFRVDYGNLNAAASTGFVEVHASRIGQIATVDYRGLGKNLNASDRQDGRWTITRSVKVNANFDSSAMAVTDSAEFRGTISMNDLRFRDGAEAIDDTDALTLGQVETMSTDAIDELRDRVNALYA